VRRADKKFVNKMSRVIIACQDGGRRSEIAAEMVTGMGYTAIATIEGGVEAYLKVSPLKEADLRPRVKRVQQEVGIKYGGTGVTSEQTPGASRRFGGPTPRVGACATLVLTHAAARALQTTARKRLSTDCSAVIEGRGGVHDGPDSGFAGSCCRVSLVCCSASHCCSNRGAPMRVPLVLYASICWAKERKPSAPVPRTKPSTSL
jgi:hypothetical protein